MARARTYELGVGCLLIGAAAVLAFMAVQVGSFSGFGDTIDVKARFHDAAGLQEGAVVAISGVDVGTVGSLELDPSTHDAAIVTLNLDPDAHVGKDAHVRVRMRSLLGEKYVEIDPGSPGAPAAVDGDLLIVDGDQLEIDELLAKMGPLMDELDPKMLANLLNGLSERMEKDPELLSRMIDNTDKLLANAATASDQLPTLLDETHGTLQQAKSTLSTVDARAKQAGPLLTKADGVLTDVDAVTGRLPATMDRVDVLLADGQTLLGEVQEDNEKIQIILDNFQGFDQWELRRLLREEGILVRLRPAEVDPNHPDEYDPRGKIKRHGDR